MVTGFSIFTWVTKTLTITAVSFIKLLIIFLIFTLLIATITLIERKVLALTQRRVGPNYVGYKGRLQFIADAIKLLVKHITILSRVNKTIFLITPAILLITIYLFWANLIWAPNLAIIEVEYNLLLMGVISSFFSYFLILVGYISQNKYAALASSRTFAMALTLDVLLSFFFISFALVSHTLSLALIGGFGYGCYFLHLWAMLPLVPIFVIVLLLETNRIPFDLAEAESELIAGYTTEYGGFFFALFYLGEYFHLFCFCAFFVTVLFGGWY